MIFVDSNIFMYAAGKNSPQREPSQQFIRRIIQGSKHEPYCTNAEVLQEILHRYISIGVRETGFRVLESVMGLGIPILPVQAEDVLRAKILLEEFIGLSTRDAVHIGVMQNHSIQKAVSYDRDFSLVSWVHRIEPENV